MSAFTSIHRLLGRSFDLSFLPAARPKNRRRSRDLKPPVECLEDRVLLSIGVAPAGTDTQPAVQTLSITEVQGFISVKDVLDEGDLVK